jgi:hypothetical protein
MLSMFILGVALLVGALLMSRWYVTADPKVLVKALKWAGLVLAVCVMAGLAATGKLWAAAAALPAVLMWFARLYSGLHYVQLFRRLFGGGNAGKGWSSPGASSGGQTNQGSDVRTRFVAAHLDHATGQVSGEVLDGCFKGRGLDDLTLDDVMELLAECQTDPDSARLVESYLERRAPGWRTRHRRQSGSQDGSQNGPQNDSQNSRGGIMSRTEALRVLGLEEGADADEIKARHRHLMAQVHPDHGGTDYLAQQINRARDVLLG